MPSLVRSLEELMAWEDRAPRVKACLTGALVRPKEAGSDTSAGSTRTALGHRQPLDSSITRYH